ncbi:MAG TPA: MoxR family ATPase [bacterium]
MFNSINEVNQKFEEKKYICSTEAATVVYLSTKIQKPLLIEGPAGVGKTELGKVLADAQGYPLIRLQCYEGLDEAKSLYEWEYSKQLLYMQILKDNLSEITSGSKSLKEAVEKLNNVEDAFFSEKFLLPRPLLKALINSEPTVLLIDEVDKADPEFEAFLLEILSDFQVTIPELGTYSARNPLQVVLTSNNTRDISDALKRRCLYLYLDFPDQHVEEKIVKSRVPGIYSKLTTDIVEFVNKLRAIDLKKKPSISETLDWARVLLTMNAKSLDEKLVNDTLSVLLKYDEDIKKIREEIKKQTTQREGISFAPEAKKTLVN